MDLSDSMVSTCGSGITAAIVALAAHLLNKEVPVYDVSYTLIIYLNYNICACRAPGQNGYSLLHPIPVLKASLQQTNYHNYYIIAD